MWYTFDLRPHINFNYSISKVIEENFDGFNTNKSGFLLNGTSTITPSSLLNDPNFKYLDRVLESSQVYKDFIRLGLIGRESFILETLNPSAFADSNEKDISGHFRLCTLNSSYQLCKSYPALFLVSKETTDDCIRKNAKSHRLNR